MCGIAHDHGAARGLDLLRGFREHVAPQEGTQLRFGGKLLELAQDPGFVVQQSALALAPYRVDQAFAVQSGADDAGGCLERQHLSLADGAALTLSDEADDACEFATDE